MLYGWVEVGASNNLLFANESNEDIILRTVYNTNKLILGNTDGLNKTAGLYVYDNNIGIRKVPDHNIALDINGSTITNNIQIGTSNIVGNLVLNGNLFIKDQFQNFNNSNNDLLIMNSNSAIKLYQNSSCLIEFRNGEGCSIQDDLYAKSFNITSDKRLKDNIENSYVEKDIEILKNIEVKEYMLNNKKVKGFLAQEIEKVLPTAVQSREGIISLNKVCEYIQHSNSFVCNDTKFEIGDELIIYEYGIPNPKRYIATVQKIEYNISYILKDILNIKSEKILIKGKIVNDLRSIDINQITAINTNVIKYLLESFEKLEKNLYSKIK